MEPASVIARSLALGVAATTERMVSAAVKDAYAALKELVRTRYPRVLVDRLEEKPESKSCRAVVEEELATSGASQDPELLAAADKLIKLIQQHAPGAAATIDVDLEDLVAGLGGQIRSFSSILNSSGNIVIGGIATGVEPVQPWPQPGKARK